MKTPTTKKAEMPALCMALDDVLDAVKEGDVPEWIPLLPKGDTIKGRSGQTWALKNPEKVIRASFSNLPKIPLDWNHQTQLRFAERNEAAAAGWIVKMEVRDGGIWGRVEWTVGGAFSVESKQYRYISPVFLHYAAGEREIVRITSAALTNNPELKMKALNTAATGGSMKDKTQQPAAASASQDAPAQPPADTKTNPEPDAQQQKAATKAAASAAEPQAGGATAGPSIEQLKAKCAAL